MEIKVGEVYRTKDESGIMISEHLVRVESVDRNMVYYRYLISGLLKPLYSSVRISHFKRFVLPITKLEKIIYGLDT